MPIPRVVRCAKEFEFAGDGGSFATEADLDALPQRVTPDCCDFVAKFGDEGRGGVVARLEIETDLMLGQAGEKAVGVAHGWPAALATECEKNQSKTGNPNQG